MGRPTLEHPCAALPAALLCGLALALAAPAAGHAASMRIRAERAVERLLGSRGLAHTRSSCRRLRRVHRRSYSCSYRGRWSLGGQVCRGRLRVRRAGRRWRTRVLSRRCRSRPAGRAPASLPGGGRPEPAPRPRPATQPQPAKKQPPRPPSSAQLFGYSDNTIQAGAAPAGQVAGLLERAGADVARVTFDWRAVEPFRDDYRWSTYDTIYREYLAHGVRPIFTILFSPWWTWDPSVSCNQWTQDCTYPPARSHDSDWREMAAQLAARYPQAAGIEIWNEPNLHWFWRPRPDVVRYTELQKHAYAAIKAVAPSMPVVSAGLNNHLRTDDQDVSMTDFASGIYQNGGKDSMDALNFHPYPWGPQQWDFDESFASLRQVRDSHGDAGKPLWVTEFGLSTTGDEPQNVFTPEQQADGLVEDYRKVRAMPDVQLVTLHTLIEPRGWRMYDPLDREVGFGVADRFLRPKPAFCALASERGVKTPCTPGVP